jgi:hypothetical protein
MTHYTWYSFSKEVRYASLLVAHGIGFLAEAFTFICLGAYIWEVSYFDSWSPVLSLIIMFSVS